MWTISARHQLTTTVDTVMLGLASRLQCIVKAVDFTQVIFRQGHTRLRTLPKQKIEMLKLWAVLPPARKSLSFCPTETSDNKTRITPIAP